MVTTEYSWMTSEELVHMTMLRDDASALEIELAQRLILALDQLLEDDADT